MLFKGRDSSVGIATRYGLESAGIESRWGGGRISAPVQTGPGPHPVSCTMGTGPFPGVKRQGRGADHPPPSKRRGHERVALYLCSPSGPSWPVIGRTFTFTLCCLVDVYSWFTPCNKERHCFEHNATSTVYVTCAYLVKRLSLSMIQ